MKNLRKLFLLALVVALSFAAMLTPRPTEATHQCYCYNIYGCCECDPRTAKIECSTWCGC
ncbi:MAG TPA: hypothetical protein VF756_29515 [Thermoanaerobaculia bacterium]